MSIDPNAQAITKWNPGDVISEGRIGFSKIEQLLNNDNAAANLLARTFNAWSLGSDVYDHFDRDVDANNWWIEKNASAGSITHDELAHLLDFSPTGTAICRVNSRSKRRVDRVPSFVEARIKNGAFTTDRTPIVGFVDDVTTNINSGSPPNNGVWFERGTNSNTYKARSRSSSTDRTTTDNLAGNYTGWDILRVEFDTEARLYINGTLVATHTVTLPTTTGLFGVAASHRTTGTGVILSVDYFVRAALQNSVSP